MDDAGNATSFDDKVLQRLHEVAEAAREVPAEGQPRRLQTPSVRWSRSTSFQPERSRRLPSARIRLQGRPSPRSSR